MDDILTREKQNETSYFAYEVCLKVQLLRYILTRIALS